MLISNVLVGCTCYSMESFNLGAYDHSKIIVEVEILKKMDDGYEKLKKAHEEEALNWNKPYPQLPLIPPYNYSDFEIAVKEVYKGNLNLNRTILRAGDKNSSCYWEPEVNNTYIFYLAKSITEDGIEVLDSPSVCNRKINSLSKNYHSEKKALNFFKNKPEGKFKINQKELIPENLKIKEFIVIEGAFKNGQRNGIWKLIEPIGYFNDKVVSNKVILSLSYENGKLLGIEEFQPINELVSSYFLRIWRMNFENKLRDL